MIKRDKEFYNQKIGELYAVIENQEKIIRGLQENYNNELDENLKLSELWFETKQRIEKAVEYIEQLPHSEWITFGRSILLEILEGDNDARIIF